MIDIFLFIARIYYILENNYLTSISWKSETIFQGIRYNNELLKQCF
jgi:hypothetical protein